MNYLKVLLAGIVATGVMTAFMTLAPYAGLPNMNAGELLGSMFGGSNLIGWSEHAFAGIFFAFIYAKFINRLLPVENNIARGAIYGIFLFILSEIVFTAVSFLGYLNWHEKESMALMIFGEGLACLLYGAVLGAFIKKRVDVLVTPDRYTTIPVMK
jgi:hypothetical protein